MCLVGFTALGVVICALSVTGAASASPLVVKGRFTQVGRGELIGDANDVLIYGQTGTLIDAATRHRSQVDEPGCSSAVALGGRRIVFFCQGDYQIYDITTGRSQPLVPCAGGSSEMGCASVTGVGSSWVSFTSSCTDHCGSPSFEYQNLQTGMLASDPTSAHVIPDLDSATLPHRLCRGVTVPPSGAGQTRGAPWVTIEGQFGIATSQGGSFLERCGSRLHQRLTYTSYPGCAHGTCPPPATSHAIVWESKPRQLTGVFLPGRRRFIMNLPARIDPAPGQYVNGDQYSLVLTAHTLYVANNQTVWATPIPTAPSRR